MPFHLFWLVGVLFLVAIAVVVVVVVAVALTRNQSPSLPAAAGPASGTPLDILARRFAAGEMSAEDYQKARDLLQGDSPRGS